MYFLINSNTKDILKNIQNIILFLRALVIWIYVLGFILLKSYLFISWLKPNTDTNTLEHQE